MLNQNLIFSTQDVSPSGTNAPVKVFFRDIDIGTIAGPQPFVNISKSYNKNSNAIIENVVHSIDLNGKILSTLKASEDTNGTTGFEGIMSSIKKMEELFDCPYGTFQIVCNDNILYSLTGVVVNNINIDNTPDNWTQSADYNINLEFTTYINGADPVTDMSESWSIEPQDDLTFMNNFYSIEGNPENPPGYGSFSPSIGNLGSSLPSLNGPGFMSRSYADALVIPQYRITRRLSAKGLDTNPIPSGQCDPNTSIDIKNRAFLNAKVWVEKQLAKPFNDDYKNNGLLYFPNPNPSGNRTVLYNHARTTNIDIYNGTYETNDTWLAMPEKIGYIETFTIDKSTSEEFITTVRVVGNIQGLIETPEDIMTGASGVLPSGIVEDNPIDLSFTEYEGQINPTTTTPINNHLPPKKTKYDSAKDGWLQKIKPSLYRRACLAINSYDRNQDYNDLSPQNTNPNYSRENFLNVIPASTSENHDPHRGTIGYSYEFNNRNRMFGSAYNGILSENVSITIDGPSDSTTETTVIGRYLGPIIQSNGKTVSRKSINVDIVIVPPSTTKESIQTDPDCPLYRDNPLWQSIDSLIEGHRPYGNRTNALFGFSRSQNEGIVYKQSDQESWNPTQGRYSRSVSWIFQQCNFNRHYMDH